MATTNREIMHKTCEMDQLFIRYAIAHEEILELIPIGSIMVFQDPDDPYFNEAPRRLALAGQVRDMAAGEGRKPLVYVTMRIGPEMGAAAAPSIEVIP